MKKGIFTVLICFIIFLFSPVTAKADVIFEPEEPIVSVLGNESGESEIESTGIFLIVGGLVAVVVIVTGILIWVFFNRKRKL